MTPQEIETLQNLHSHEAREAMTDAQVGAHRKIAILDIVHRFGYSTMFVILRFLDPTGKEKTQIQKLVKRMTGQKNPKNALLRPFELSTSVSKLGYYLTEAGYNELSKAYPERELGKLDTNGYKKSVSNKIHDTCVQAAIAESIMNDKHYCGFITELEIRRSLQGSPASTYFDAIVEKTVNQEVMELALEVEISQKEIPYLSKSLRAKEKLADKLGIQIIVYACSTNALKRLVERQVKESGVNPKRFAVSVSPTVAKIQNVGQVLR